MKQLFKHSLSLILALTLVLEQEVGLTQNGADCSWNK